MPPHDEMGEVLRGEHLHIEQPLQARSRPEAARNLAPQIEHFYLKPVQPKRHMHRRTLVGIKAKRPYFTVRVHAYERPEQPATLVP